MDELLSNQLDYILFFYGFALVLLGSISLARARARDNVLPWRWLAAFGVLRGLCEWIRLAALSLEGDALLSALCAGCLFLSCVFLTEFGRVGWARVRGRQPGRWTLVPFIALAGLGGLAGPRGLEVSSGYALRIVGGIWSARAMLAAASGMDAEGARWMRVTAVLLAAQSVLSGLIRPDSELWPASIVNQSSFLSLTNVPVQLLNAVLTVLIAAALWNSRQPAHGQYGWIGKRWAGLQMTGALVAVVAIGWAATSTVGRLGDGQFRRGLQLRAATAASVLDPSLVRQVAASPGDSDVPAYQRLLRQMRAIRMNNPDCRFVYLMGKRNGRVVFLQDAEPVRSHDYSQPGQLYKEASADLLLCFQSGGSFVEGPLKDSYGTWVSGIVGIRDPVSGRIPAVFGMDVDAAQWRQAVATYRLFCIVITLLLCLLTLTFFLILDGTAHMHAATAASERRYRVLVENAADGIFLHDLTGKLVDVNQRACDSLGYTREELLAMSVGDIEIGCDAERLRSLWDDVSAHGTRTTYGTLRRKDGSEFPVEVRISLLDTSGRQLLLAVACDITQRRLAEAKLRIQTSAINAASDQIVIARSDGTIVFVNPAFERETGYSSAEAVGQNPRLLKSGKHDQQFYAQLWDTILSGETWHGEITNRRKDGSIYTEDSIITPVKNEDGAIEHFVAIKRNITEKKIYEEKLDHLAHHDALTGLPNRLLFSDRLTQRLAQARRTGKSLSVMFIDLDGFKEINDTLGHKVGDELLKAVAQRLRACLRDTDTLARMGGDEFTVILGEGGERDETYTVARRILGAFAQPFELQGRPHSISGSMGISSYPSDGNDVEALVRNADAAMYRAKERGGNRFEVYSESVGTAHLEHRKVENELRAALERGEFVVYYQPRVDINTGEVRAAEALVRWQHPDLGLVAPASFIPAAEESGLLVPITEWVMQTACAQAKAWQDAGLARIRVAVNVSDDHFQQQELAATVHRVLRGSGLEPTCLDLDLSESTLMRNPEAAAAILNALKEMGVSVSVDDFGTGYSSLGYLKRFKIDSVKIDRSIVKELITNPDDAAVAGATVAMAHSLKLQVIAEGVETVKQLEFLRTIHADEIQGYFVSPPVTPDTFAQFLPRSDLAPPNGLLAA